MKRPPKIVFLPGASGAGEYWQPVAGRLPDGWQKTLLSWPGAGEEPHDPHVRSFEDLIAIAWMVLSSLRFATNKGAEERSNNPAAPSAR
jgi:surfactin synthase thioesterase subunit